MMPAKSCYLFFMYAILVKSRKACKKCKKKWKKVAYVDEFEFVIATS